MCAESARQSSSEQLILPLLSILERLNLDHAFNRPAPLEVELGSGDGSFLVAYAASRPDHNFIGVERLLGRLRKLVRKAHRTGLQNVRGLRIESSYFLEYLLPKRSVEAIHLYFPDPWPKRKHRRHRIVNEGFPALAKQALVPSGVVYLRTDDLDYFTQMQTVFSASPLFKLIETPAALADIRTDFERDFNARGIATLHAAYQEVGG
jgi:tRNA (guanine-N7-)-methyltransferase